MSKINRSLIKFPVRPAAIYRAGMVEVKVRIPEDIHRAMKLTAQRQGTSIAAVARTGILSYVAFDLARAGDAASDAIGALFDAAQHAAEAWPL